MITNIAAYRFAPLSDLKSLRERLIAQCRAGELKGTILLSTEGINLFMAGREPEIQKLLGTLRSLPGFESLEPKVSRSENQPFNRMLVRIKKEIIAFGVEGIEPGKKTSRKLTAQALKQWLDEGRPVTLLDTRNDYEARLGTFKGAKTLGIDHFREFPEAIRHLPEEMKDQPIVMFCTGGIRCEKAGPYMEKQGYRDIFQLEGGILKYFEECGASHYEGECFVFDQRVGVDPALRETDSVQCYRCLTPLTETDQQDVRYRPNQSCPYCFTTSAERMKTMISRRHDRIREITTPLPGSTPYDNKKPVIVSEKWHDATLLDFLCGILPHVPREEWTSICTAGRWLDRENRPCPTTHRIKAGERYYLLQPALVEPDVNAEVRILHEDESILVLHKPAPLPIHPSGRFNRNTLQSILHEVYRPQKPRAVHRLDADTTGLVLCTRTRYFASLLQPQFERGEVEKLYLARVLGQPAWDRWTSEEPLREKVDLEGNRGTDPENGLRAKTEFTVLKRLDDGTALLQARLITGRTNQIRIHLAELGFPIRGDRSYSTDSKSLPVQCGTVNDAPLCLHAWKLSFMHPLSREKVHFEAAPGPWMGYGEEET